VVFLMSCIVVAGSVSLVNRDRLLSRVYQYRFPALALGISLMVGAALAESLARLTDPLGISNYEASSRYHLDKIADDELIYRHRPNSHAVYNGIEVHINELGLRDRPVLPKQQDEYRVVALGDSVTFGWGVPEEHVFATRLEEILSHILGRSVTVLNTGVGSYNTVQEYAFLKSYGRLLQPDLLILLYVTNDIEIHQKPFNPWDQVSLKGKSPSEAAMILLGKTWCFRLFHHAVEHGWLSGRTSPEPSGGRSQSPGLKDSMEALRNIVAFSESARIPLAVFFFRWDTGAKDAALLADVQQAVTPRVVGDVGQWFSGQEITRYVNSIVDSHPNAEGHRIIAEQMAKSLIRQNLLPIGQAAAKGQNWQGLD